MNAGKAASQAGHAFLGAYLNALEINPNKCKEYHSDGMGTKVCLKASLEKILQARELAIQRGLPCYLVVDSGCPDFFEGRPVVTAFGLGPITKNETQDITGKFPLMK